MMRHTISHHAGGWPRERGDSVVACSVLRIERAPEQHNVRLRPMDRVVHPTARLLHANAAPLGLTQKAALWHHLGNVRGQDHMLNKKARQHTSVHDPATGIGARTRYSNSSSVYLSDERSSV